jgi:hypothetical protein
VAVGTQSIWGISTKKFVAAAAFEAGDQSASLDTKRAPSALCGKIFLGGWLGCIAF